MSESQRIVERVVDGSHSCVIIKFIKQKAADMRIKLKFVAVERFKKDQCAIVNKRLGFPPDHPMIVAQLYS